MCLCVVVNKISVEFDVEEASRIVESEDAHSGDKSETVSDLFVLAIVCIFGVVYN